MIVRRAISQATMCASAQSSASIKMDLIRHALLAGRTIQLRLTGTSMMPTICPGDLVWVKPVKVEELGPGDVILFLRDDRYTVHRIVAMDVNADKLVIRTRGDTLLSDDQLLRASEVKGLVTATQRFGTERPICRVPQLASRILSGIVRRSDRFRHLIFRLNLKLSQNTRAAERAW